MSFFQTKIEFLKGVGPQKATSLNTELGIFNFGDMLQHYPFRHEDRSEFQKIRDIHEGLGSVQVLGRVNYWEEVGDGKRKRLVATLRDETGEIDLVWFQSAKWVAKSLKKGVDYIVYGKVNAFGGHYSISHPEMEILTEASKQGGKLVPVYHTTEKMKRKFLDTKGIAKIQQKILEQAYDKIPESLPNYILEKYHFISKKDAVKNVHFPEDLRMLEKAIARLKFEELFYIQLKQLQTRIGRVHEFPGQVFAKIPTLNRFYKDLLPFDLTGAQKRVTREIYDDMRSGSQMNRLLQGDVGSGKTIVAFICMLMAIDNGAQACMMAPTEILAGQHYQGLKEFADILGITIAKLTGSSKKSERKVIDETLRNGELNIIVGTHALIEDKVDFQNLGLCVIDEQHRFGVAQRAKLWNKSSIAHPHMLVMTATPIPRTLAMTVYGDLSLSIIDEMPKGRKPIQTFHKFDSNRLWAFGAVKKEIQQGRQAYIVYPLVEESETLDYKNLMDGYESVSRAFPENQISIVHGRMKSADKDFEMQRFVKNETQIMVATTVIEVGVNVPNASIMIIENAEKFGLAQLHQLRGRVGRGAEQSYCILMSGVKLSKNGKTRLQTMVKTTNGFEIADTDLKLRGPGDMMGTQQSGILDLKFADLAKDGKIIEEARNLAGKILSADETLSTPENQLLKKRLASFKDREVNWSRIS
ncbi:MAG: ATP-dependent DNA helicase RecG [Arenicella sp.]